MTVREFLKVFCTSCIFGLIGCCDQFSRSDITPQEKESIIEELVREVSSLWQTEEVRKKKPTPVDGEQTLVYNTFCFLKQVMQLFLALASACEALTAVTCSVVYACITMLSLVLLMQCWVNWQHFVPLVNCTVLILNVAIRGTGGSPHCRAVPVVRCTILPSKAKRHS